MGAAALRRLRLVAGAEWRGPGRRLAAGGDVNRRRSPGRLRMEVGSGGWVVGRPREGLHRKLARIGATTRVPGASTDFYAFVDLEGRRQWYEARARELPRCPDRFGEK